MALPQPHDVRSILVIHVSRIGDTLFATPALRALAAAYPSAQITVLAHPKRAEVLEHLPFLSTVGHITKNRARWLGWIGRRQFDLAIVYGFDEPLVRYALRVARHVVAFSQADDALNQKLAAAVNVPPFQDEHAVRYYLRLPAAVGADPQGLRLAYALTEDERSVARDRLQKHGFAQSHPLIGLQVASFPTKAYRDWPIENFAEFCSRASSAWAQSRFLIFGGSEERVRTAWLKQTLGDRAALFAGTLTLRETAALMSLTDLYVGVDTGPTHLMSTFDIPLIGLYHCASSADHTGPLEHPLAELINHPKTGKDCTEHSSMAEISVDVVFAAAMRALGGAR